MESEGNCDESLPKINIVGRQKADSKLAGEGGSFELYSRDVLDS
jgi:hypothetical protein